MDEETLRMYLARRDDAFEAWIKTPWTSPLVDALYVEYQEACLMFRLAGATYMEADETRRDE